MSRGEWSRGSFGRAVGKRAAPPSRCADTAGLNLCTQEGYYRVRFETDGFDWDEGNRQKCRKHGLSEEEIEAVFLGEPAVYADPDHSIAEQRLKAIGRTGEGRWVFVAFTLRSRNGRQLIRPISARYMHDREVHHYARRK